VEEGEHVVTILPRGEATTFTAQFRDPPGGPLVDVVNLEFLVYSLATGNVVAGPVTMGFVHPATGIYAYTWDIPGTLAIGEYVVVWDAETLGGDPVQSAEVVTITAANGFESGPCEIWEPVWCGPLPTGSEAVTGTALAMATEVLWQAVGQRFGLCAVTIRPCREDCATGWTGFNEWWPGVGSGINGSGGGPRPWWYNGTWYNVCSSGCGMSCSCTLIDEALLPAPTRDVLQVKMDGEVMDPSLYRVDENRKLIRLDNQLWPLCQNMAQDDSQPGTWSVTITVGEDVPLLAKRALGQLAMEFVKDCLGEDCALPWEVSSISRQGVNVVFNGVDDMREILGQMGLKFVDLLVATYNPHRLQHRAKVYDVDHNPRPWRRVDTS
jgi:hypothetical protein